VCPLLHAHLVFVTKYRRREFADAILTYSEHTMDTVCAELKVELVEFNGEPDHVHPLVADPPTTLDFCSCAAPQARVDRRVCPPPHPRAPLVAVLFRGLLQRRTAIHRQQYIDGQARPL